MATIYRRGSRWYINYRDERGKQRRQSLGEITEAEAKACLRRFALTNRSRQRGTLFSAFVSDHYLPWRKKEFPSSFRNVESVLRLWLLPVFGNKLLGSVTAKDIEDYKSGRVAKPLTIRRELEIIKAIFAKAVEWGFVQANPARYVRAPKNLDSKPPLFYTTEQLRAIYEASRPGDVPIWKLFANTGLRRTEALQLKHTDIRQGSVYVLSSGKARTKSAKWRRVPMNEEARAAYEHLKQRTGDTEYVLPRINKDVLSIQFVKVLRTLGLGGSLHSLRHTFASHLVMNGVPLAVVKDLLGHATITTTEIYAHLAPQVIDASVHRIRL